MEVVCVHVLKRKKYVEEMEEMGGNSRGSYRRARGIFGWKGW